LLARERANEDGRATTRPHRYGGIFLFGILCAGEEEELLDLVRGDISEDAAITLALEEPTGSGSSVDAMWAQPNRASANRVRDDGRSPPD
jgi:hypothetical protein